MNTRDIFNSLKTYDFPRMYGFIPDDLSDEELHDFDDAMDFYRGQHEDAHPSLAKHYQKYTREYLLAVILAKHHFQFTRFVGRHQTNYGFGMIRLQNWSQIGEPYIYAMGTGTSHEWNANREQLTVITGLIRYESPIQIDTFNGSIAGRMFNQEVYWVRNNDIWLASLPEALILEAMQTIQLLNHFDDEPVGFRCLPVLWMRNMQPQPIPVQRPVVIPPKTRKEQETEQKERSELEMLVEAMRDEKNEE